MPHKPPAASYRLPDSNPPESGQLVSTHNPCGILESSKVKLSGLKWVNVNKAHDMM